MTPCFCNRGRRRNVILSGKRQHLPYGRSAVECAPRGSGLHGNENRLARAIPVVVERLSRAEQPKTRRSPRRMTIPERFLLAPGLEISRILTGLWQVADMERDGHALDLDAAVAAMADYADAGFDSFDMADHYGSAEDIAGRCVRLFEGRGSRRPTLFTKWCPVPGEMSPAVVRAAVQRSLDRLSVPRLDLLQFHWWTFEHPAYLDAMLELAALQAKGLIAHLGVTNFDTDHLRVLVKHGIRVASNQVCFSLLDRRAGEEMSAFCRENGVRLLAYGTLAGGLLSERWLGKT